MRFRSKRYLRFDPYQNDPGRDLVRSKIMLDMGIVPYTYAEAGKPFKKYVGTLSTERKKKALGRYRLMWRKAVKHFGPNHELGRPDLAGMNNPSPGRFHHRYRRIAIIAYIDLKIDEMRSKNSDEK